VNKQRIVYLGQTSENGGVRGEILAHFDESPNDIDAHGHGPRAVQYVGSHERAVLGKRDRKMADIAFGCGRKLRPHTSVDGGPGFSHSAVQPCLLRRYVHRHTVISAATGARRICGTMNVSVTIKLTVPAAAKHFQQVREATAGLTDSRGSVEVVQLPGDPTSVKARFTVPDARQEDVADRIGRRFWNVGDYSTSTIGFGPRRRSARRSGRLPQDQASPKLRQTVLEVVENQIRDNEPPETRQTVERLMAEGYGADEARRLVATAVVVEIFHTMRDKEPFNRERFVSNLAHLPNALCDEDGKPQ
jgi:hypothetical protein